MKDIEKLIKVFNANGPRHAELEAVTAGVLKYFVLITETDGTVNEYAFRTCREFRYFMRGYMGAVPGSMPIPEDYYRVRKPEVL